MWTLLCLLDHPDFWGHHLEAFVETTSLNTFVDWGVPHSSSFSLLSCPCVEFSSDPVGQEPRAHFCCSRGIFRAPRRARALLCASDVICQNSNRLLSLSSNAEPWCLVVFTEIPVPENNWGCQLPPRSSQLFSLAENLWGRPQKSAHTDLFSMSRRTRMGLLINAFW